MIKRITKTIKRPSKPIVPKPVHHSKTVWYGIGIIIMSSLSYLQAQPTIASNPSWVCGLGVTIGIIVIALRFLSDRPVMPSVRVIQRKK